MIARFVIRLLSLSLLTSMVISTPFPHQKLQREILPRDYSLNNYGGFSAMSNFDDFNGANNFDGSRNEQKVVVDEKEKVVCKEEEIKIVQQRLVILKEVAKRIILEKICEVEVQLIVHEQFRSSILDFKKVIKRSSDKQVGYDSAVAGRYSDIFNADGSLSSNDLGFSGYGVGQSTIVPGGSNWDSSTSPASVSTADNAAMYAQNATLADNSTSVDPSTGADSNTSTSTDPSTSTTADPSASTSTADSSSANPNPASD